MFKEVKSSVTLFLIDSVLFLLDIYYTFLELFWHSLMAGRGNGLEGLPNVGNFRNCF